jgi:hypothetical protein
MLDQGIVTRALPLLGKPGSERCGRPETCTRTRKEHRGRRKEHRDRRGLAWPLPVTRETTTPRDYFTGTETVQPALERFSESGGPIRLGAGQPCRPAGVGGVAVLEAQQEFAARGRSLYASARFWCGGPRYGKSWSKSSCGPTPSSVTFPFVKMAALESPTSSVSRRPLSG